MTDHRVTDLSHGYLGELTYDTHDNLEWSFSRALNDDGSFQQLAPFKQCVPPSILRISEEKKRSSHVARSHLKWLTKAHPDIFPAKSIAASLEQVRPSLQLDQPSTFGTLLALGKAVSTDHSSGSSRRVPIAAMACGEAGHILRLIHPKAERHGWEKGGGVKLSSLDLGSSDQGHWIGTGGTIHQIVFADDEDEVGTWFAVRQNAITTVFRPIYRKVETPFVARTSHGNVYPHSRLDPNPVISLSTDHTGSSSHVDVTFNPWYSRQVAVVDENGRWSLWDIEGRKNKWATLEVVAGKSGEIHDGSIQDVNSKTIDNADGWHKILWAGGVSTVVVCNRRKLTVFDIKANPTLLDNLDLMVAGSLDWILDMKRSSANLSHLFVLTSSRVFWLEVIPAGEKKESRDSGARILLSYRHFRDPSDETMKLTVHGNGLESLVLVSSSKNSVVHFFRFRKTSNEASKPVGSQGLIIMSSAVEIANAMEGPNPLQTLCIMSAQLSSTTSARATGFGPQYLENDVRFYQVWALKSDLEVVSSLCAISSVSARVVVPTIRATQPLAPIASRLIRNMFVVPDSFDDDLEANSSLRHINVHFKSKGNIGISTSQEDLAMRINSRSSFRRLFMEDGSTISSNDQLDCFHETNKSVVELLDIIRGSLREGQQMDTLGLSSFLELANFTLFSGDFGQASSTLQEFATSLDLDDLETVSELVPTGLASCPGVGLLTSNAQDTPLDVLQVYDRLVQIWVTSLPLKASNQARLAKFKIIRKMAIELSLASIAVSLHNKFFENQQGQDEVYETNITLSLREKQKRMSRSSSPALMSSQTNPDSSREPYSSLPTPSRTPSLYSQTTGTASDQAEDLAITRIREYSPGVKDIGEPLPDCSWLSFWRPGSYPSTYLWDAAQKSTAAQLLGSDDEEKHARHREEARRRRRTEKFLKKERAKSSQVTSQSAFASFGSQPEVNHHALSSQVIDDVPMTQPDRGTFGSRATVQPIKKHKRRRAAGF